MPFGRVQLWRPSVAKANWPMKTRREEEAITAGGHRESGAWWSQSLVLWRRSYPDRRTKAARADFRSCCSRCWHRPCHRVGPAAGRGTASASLAEEHRSEHASTPERPCALGRSGPELLARAPSPCRARRWHTGAGAFSMFYIGSCCNCSPQLQFMHVYSAPCTDTAVPVWTYLGIHFLFCN